MKSNYYVWETREPEVGLYVRWEVCLDPDDSSKRYIAEESFVGLNGTPVRGVDRRIVANGLLEAVADTMFNLLTNNARMTGYRRLSLRESHRVRKNVAKKSQK